MIDCTNIVSSNQIKILTNDNESYTSSRLRLKYIRFKAFGNKLSRVLRVHNTGFYS